MTACSLERHAEIVLSTSQQCYVSSWLTRRLFALRQELISGTKQCHFRCQSFLAKKTQLRLFGNFNHKNNTCVYGLVANCSISSLSKCLHNGIFICVWCAHETNTVPSRRFYSNGEFRLNLLPFGIVIDCICCIMKWFSIGLIFKAKCCSWIYDSWIRC